LFLGLSIQPLLAQEQIIKDLFETGNEKKYAFYASTLRMVNLTKNKEYNELVNGIDKLLVYSLDSATIASKSYKKVADAYLNEGFEEYIMAFGGDINIALIGKENKRANEFAGYTNMDGNTFAFYLRGSIAWEKIPSLLKSIRKEEFLTFLP